MVCTRYRPRQPCASPVWQVLHDHASKGRGLSPDAAEREPVFWTDGAGQSTREDDFVQADALESV